MSGSDRIRSRYDVVIIGAGHNGLVAACYLAGSGLSVLMLEKNAEVGGATRSARVFPDYNAHLSVYAYLVSLFPQKILDDLGLKLDLRSRKIASYTPRISGDGRTLEELVVSNGAPEVTRDSFAALTGNDRDHRGYRKLQAMQDSLAQIIWPTLVEPIPAKSDLARRFRGSEEKAAWNAFIEEPLGGVIERNVAHDLIRGMIFTDAKIGVSTWPDDPSLLQNRTFLYHIIGRGTGQWMTPVGGMGALVNQLKNVALKRGVRIVTRTEVESIDSGETASGIRFSEGEKPYEIDARYLLCNAPEEVLNRLLSRGSDGKIDRENEGSVFKINLLLKRLPRLRSNRVSAEDAFTGTFHVDEGYAQMRENYHQSRAGVLSDQPAFEVYCHSLTDDSILSEELAHQRYQTLTCFGLDAPYRLFENDNAVQRSQLLENVFRGMNRYLAEPLEECLALDAEGEPCVEIKTPVDLENEIHLPRGNIFHNALTWPFGDDDSETGTWGVETGHGRIFLCGASAKRGGCVSGIPGHNAARKVMECEGAG